MKNKLNYIKLKQNKLQSKAIVQFNFFIFVGKYLKACFVTLCLIFFSSNSLLSPNDSYQEILASINFFQLIIKTSVLLIWGLEVHGVLLHISKASNKLWHDGVIFKQRQNRTCGEMINILEAFLSDRKKRVVLDGQCSPFADIRASVPQGSTCGTLLFWTYNCNLSNYKKVNANRLLRHIFVFCSSWHSANDIHCNSWYFSK